MRFDYGDWEERITVPCYRCGKPLPWFQASTSWGSGHYHKNPEERAACELLEAVTRGGRL